MPQTRYFSDTAVDTALASGINDTTTTIEVLATTGFPSSFPYTLVIDKGTENEELVNVTGASGTTLSVTRGYAGTGAISHATGAAVKHVFTGSDATDANAHAGASQNVHGLSAGASVVGTSTVQTLSGKTISGAANTITNIQQSAVVGLEQELQDATQDADAVPFTPAGTLAATDVQAALEELDTDVQGVAADLATLDSEKQDVSGKNAANGYAGLNASSKLAFSQIPTGTSASTVSEGDHDHVAEEHADTSLTERTFLSAQSNNPLTLATSDSLPAGKYLILASCAGYLPGDSSQQTRMEFWLETSAGTLRNEAVRQSVDQATVQGGGSYIGYLDTPSAAVVTFRAQKLNTGTSATTSTTGMLIAIRLGS